MNLSIERENILIVDDDVIDRERIRRLLEVPPHAFRISEADTLAGARVCLSESPVDAMLLDYRLPDGNGVDFVQKLRESGDNRPILVLTGQGDEQVAAAIMRAGASAYLVKSDINAVHLRTTINSILRQHELEQEKERLELERSRLLDEIQSDLDVASEFQKATLPEIEDLSYLRVAYVYRPAGKVSGDMYDYFCSAEGNASFFIGDATGHGVAGAFLTMMMQFCLDSLRGDITTSDAMSQINARLSARELRGRFVTGIFLRINTDGRLTTANAGHPPLFILPYNSSTPIFFTTGGMALGMFKSSNVPYQEQTYQLQRGDTVVVYTDGLVECSNDDEENFGTERLVDFFKDSQNADIGDSVGLVLQKAELFAGDNIRNDDVTLFAFRYLGPPA